MMKGFDDDPSLVDPVELDNVLRAHNSSESDQQVFIYYDK